MKKFTRDDTEHGKEYYLASDVEALMAQPEQEPVIDCPFCLHSFRLRDVYTTPPKELNK